MSRDGLQRLGRTVVTVAVLLGLWQIAFHLTGERRFLLPSPAQTLEVLVERHVQILEHAGVTFAEILLGLGLGCVLGVGTALLLASFRPVRRWLMPVLVVSQAIPVFAIAPLLVLWLGYGLGSKVAMATLIIYFPVTAAFFDGLRRTDPGWMDLARVMGGGRFATLRHIRLPAALPAFASGLRVATAVAPIGAVVGEWVGSSAGLGYLMLQANARMQVPMMFAALFVLAVFAVALYTAVDVLLRRALPWVPDDGRTS
ncbi:Hydroxymethylpyrimidine ABC transporter, transmembrane component [Caenispirillum salinarum AK4]|uniref:Hydroxymethylpyrimidine ABC transporter, transmembrane component n=1 Tax=Caenispirillum salinarum AK4 TaxID=1238182 RepID=K9H1F4_9PROT|nr:ABC transporter permease [Caenispirillum salinarum]EKV30899.1 Hydroxymethylpyrimidine ABC transporter, transmembrane component [Caenispirillum salinarum AK4]